MRRATQILLVLMGGGAVAASVAVPMLRGRECAPELRVNGACPDGGSRGGVGSHFWSGGSSSRIGTGTSAASPGIVSVARGGFGSTGSARASSGGG